MRKFISIYASIQNQARKVEQRNILRKLLDSGTAKRLPSEQLSAIDVTLYELLANLRVSFARILRAG